MFYEFYYNKIIIKSFEMIHFNHTKGGSENENLNFLKSGKMVIIYIFVGKTGLTCQVTVNSLVSLKEITFQSIVDD